MKTGKLSTCKSAAMKSSKNKIALGISGADGRMGRALITACAADDAISLRFVCMADGHPLIGKTIDGAPPIDAAADIVTADIQTLIDFTEPAATMRFAELCGKRGIGMVVGTTGFSGGELSRLRRAARRIPLLVAQNMSIGVNVAYAVAADAATRLKAGKLGGGYDIEIFEAHHRDKKDAPSGTALRLGQILAQATGGNFAKNAVYARQGRDALQGRDGKKSQTRLRQAADIGFSVLRGGDIVGEHRVIFAGAGEQLEIIHRSTSRANYAAGALRAAKFIAAAAPGFYDGMESVL